MADITVVVLITAGIVGFFFPVWGAGRLFISDGQYAAFFSPAANWSDAWGGGWVIGSDTAQYVWYPMRLLALWMGLGFNGFVVSAYVIAAVGTYAYLRLLDLSRGAAAFGGVSFALSGFMVAQLLHTSMIHAAAWVPWVFAGIEGCLARGERRWVGVGAIAVAMACLAGHVQIAFYGLMVAGAYLLWRLPASWRAGRMREWALAGAGLVLGVLLAAPQLLITTAYVRETPRAFLDYESFVAFSLPWAQLPTLLFPFLFGSDHRSLGTPYFGAENFAELCMYIPFLSLVLAVPGVLLARRSVAGFWVGVAIAALLLALGGSLPPLAALVYRVPGFNQFRVPARHLMELCLATSVLAAFGMEWLARRPPGRELGWFAAVVAVLAVVAFVSSIPAHATAAEAAARARIAVPPWSQDPAVWMGGLGIVAGLLALGALASGRRLGMVVFAGGAVVGLATYAWYGDWRLTPTGGAPAATALERDIGARLAAGGGRVLHAEGGWGTPFTAGRTRKLGMPSLNWYGPLIPLRAQELLQMTANGVIALATLAPENAALDVYGGRYVAIGVAPTASNRAKVTALSTARWRQVGRERDVIVYENTRALPLAWLTPTWRAVPAEEALRRLQTDAGFDPRAEALVEGVASGGSAAASTGTVTARWVDHGRIAIDVDAPESGFLVVSVNGVTGWTATVDGAAVPVYPADYALIGVPLAAGRHAVRVAFRTSAWQWAVPWSLALLGGVALARSRRGGWR